MEIALEYRDFGFSYPNGHKVLGPVSWQVERGSLAVLVGATGCGKTTLLRNAKPELAPTGSSNGQVLVSGKDVDTLEKESSARIVGYVSQNPDAQIVCDTVWHQMAFGLENLGIPQPEMRRRVAEVSHFFGIATWFRRNVNELSGGQRQLLNLASALVMRPDVLLLDEPTSQLDPIAGKDFIHALFRLHNELGLTVVVATHSPQSFVGYATSFALVESGTVHEIDESVVSSYTLPAFVLPAFPRKAGEGRDAYQKKKAIFAKGDSKALSFKDVYVRYGRGEEFVLRGLDLEVEKGSVHAVVGGNGCGKTTMLKTAAGLMKPARGSFCNPLKDRQVLLPQDPKALFVCDTVEDELREWQQSCGYTNAQINEVCRRYDLAHLLEQHPYDLSGGQQQLLAFAKLELVQPELWLLDEPTKGLDPEARASIAQAVRGAASRGCTVCMVTHDLAFAACVANRVTLLFDGQSACTQPADEFFEGNLFYKPEPDAFYRAVMAARGESASSTDGR